MKFTGENLIPATPDETWQALNDPEVLRESIPGCKELEKLSETDYRATVVAKVGPIKATFKGEVSLQDLDPPNGYTLAGQGTGKGAGKAKGIAQVKLLADDEGTRLTYDVTADVTGKMAQLGARLLQSTARSFAGKFFNRFEALVSGTAEAAE